MGIIKYRKLPTALPSTLACMLILIFGFCIFTSLVLASSSGIRGTDQFWYVSEIRSVLEGDPRTNSLFPNLIQRSSKALAERPFVHNTIYPYLVAPLARLWNPYYGAVLFNLAFTMATALLIYLSILISGEITQIRRIGATISALVFLFLPISFWQASQPMPEAMLAFLSALCCFLVISGFPKYILYAIFVDVILIAQSLRSVFGPAIILASLALLVSLFRTTSNKRWFDALYIATISFIALMVLRLQATTGPYSILEIAQAGANNHQVMEAYFADGYLHPNLRDILLKSISNFQHIFKPSTMQLFMLPFTLLCLGNLVIITYQWQRECRLFLSSHYLSLLGIVLYVCSISLAMLILNGYQFRYSFISIPPLIIIFAVTLICIFKNTSTLINHPRIALVTVLIYFGTVIAADCVLATTLFVEGKEVSLRIERMKQSFVVIKNFSATDVIMDCYDAKHSYLTFYAFPKKLFVHFDPDTGADYFRRIVSMTGSNLLICSKTQAAKIVPESILQNPVGRIDDEIQGLNVYDLHAL